MRMRPAEVLRAVVPSGAAQRRHSVKQSWQRAWEVWYRFQISRQGKYSIERLQALDEYCRVTSLTRVLCVCFVTPLPALAAVLLIESMPLCDPVREWRRDWALWVRIWLTLFFVSFGVVVVAMVTIIRLPLTHTKCLVVAIGTATGYVALLRVVATNVTFPIPFVFVLGALPSAVLCCAMLLLVLGRKPFQVHSGIRAQLMWFFRFFAVQASLMLIYSCYNAVFVAIEAKYQNALVLALPLIKLVVKNAVSRSAVHLEDYLPQTVVCLVEVFNTLYLTVCMQNAGSLLTALLIMLTDFVQGVWALRGVHKRTKVVQEMITAYTKRRSLDHTDSSKQVDFLRIVISICEHPMRLEVPELGHIRLRACLPHSYLSQHSIVVLELLEKLNVYGDSSSSNYGAFRRRRSLPKSRSLRSRRSNSSVVPGTLESTSGAPSPRFVAERHSVSRLYDSVNSAGRTDSNQARLSNAAARHKTRLLFQTLQMLFHCEYLVLVEYVECFVPLLYVAYTLILSHLPNAAYYPSAPKHMTSTVTNVLLYAGVELLSFAVLHIMFKRTFRFSPLYQLAFVFENQRELVQSMLLIWIVILLQFHLKHFGASCRVVCGRCEHGLTDATPFCSHRSGLYVRVRVGLRGQRNAHVVDTLRHSTQRNSQVNACCVLQEATLWSGIQIMGTATCRYCDYCCYARDSMHMRSAALSWRSAVVMRIKDVK